MTFLFFPIMSKQYSEQLRCGALGLLLNKDAEHKCATQQAMPTEPQLGTLKITAKIIFPYTLTIYKSQLFIYG
jgi:hypothetical protein